MRRPGGTHRAGRRTGSARRTGPAGGTGSRRPCRPGRSRWERIHAAQGAPDDDLGNSGDFYLDLSTGEFYGPKTREGWGGPTYNLTGTTLEPGESCQLSYRFTPTEEGEVTESTNGSWNGQPFAVDFRGIGIADVANSVQLLPMVHFFDEKLYTLDFLTSQPSVITLTLLEHNNEPDPEDIIPAIRANSQFRYVLVPPGIPAPAEMSGNFWWDYQVVAEYYGLPDR